MLKPLCVLSRQGEASHPSGSRHDPRHCSLGGQCHGDLETTEQDLSHGEDVEGGGDRQGSGPGDADLGKCVRTSDLEKLGYRNKG